MILRLKAGSDGDPTHRPTNPVETPQSPTTYLEKLGMFWINDRPNEQKLPGVSYVLEALPTGYALFGRPRKDKPSHVDKWLYGHPGHKRFDSVNRFYPHFKYLMDNNGDSMGCPCTVCNGKAGSAPPRGAAGAFKRGSQSDTSSTSTLVPGVGVSDGTGAPAPTGVSVGVGAAVQSKGRPKKIISGMSTSQVDEEGTPDVIRNLINYLKSYGSIDEAIVEPLSVDWRADQEALPKFKEELQEGAPRLPRAGEIVLFIRELPAGVMVTRDSNSGSFELYNPTTKTYLGYPPWEAGLVAQTPMEETDLDDLVHEPSKEFNVSYSGIRVEPLPNLKSYDKSISKRSRYIPVHQTRPFIFWKEYLNDIPEEHWHPTIKNALAALATLSFVDKHRFKGTWPEAWIYFHAIYIGSELLAVGDTIRLLPKSVDAICEDILVIKTIRLKLTNLDKASDNDWDGGRPWNSSAYVFGTGYTTDQSRSSKDWLHKDYKRPAVMRRYEAQYPLHPPNKEMMVPFNRVLGRLYDADAMTLWLPSLSNTKGKISPPDLNHGREGVLKGRAYAKTHDPRIAESFGTQWFLGDHRSDALDLKTFNGLEVTKYDTERNPKEWRKQIKVLEIVENEQNRVEQKIELNGHKNLKRFMAPSPNGASFEHKLPVRSGSARLSVERIVPNSGSGTFGRSHPTASGISFKKRAKTIVLSDDDEDDIRGKARLVSDKVEGRKKVKVSVVIDK